MGCVGVKGGSSTSRGQAQLKKERKWKKTQDNRMGQQQRGERAEKMNVAHGNNDLILETMHNMIGQNES